MSIKQSHISAIVHQYLINRGRNELAEKMSPGYCLGLSLYFLDRAANGKVDTFFKLLKDVSQWDGSEDKKLIDEFEFKHLNTPAEEKRKLRASILPDDINLEKLINNMEWLQDKYKLLSEHMPISERMNFLHENDKPNGTSSGCNKK